MSVSSTSLVTSGFWISLGERLTHTDSPSWPGKVCLPLACLPACLVEHLAADRGDQSDLLGQRHEGARKDEPALRVEPARERLDRDRPTGLQADDRLVVDADLVAFDGLLERGRELVAPADACVHARLVERVAPLAAALRRVHRDVGIREQLVGRARPGATRRDPDARVDHHLASVERERRAQGLDDPARDALRLPLTHALEQHAELVAAEPRRRVARPAPRPARGRRPRSRRRRQRCGRRCR